MAPPRFPRPIVVVSKCLTGARCRYDGEAPDESLVRALRKRARLVAVCPEMKIGLGLPRDPIRIVSRRGGVRLIQPSTCRDLTARMRRFCGRFLDSLGAVDGFLLKSRSPSCGIRDAKVFSAGGAFRGPGIFAAEAARRFPHAAMTDERQWGRARKRERFLTRILVAAAFRAAKRRGLRRFHEEHGWLFSSRRLRAMEAIVAEDRIEEYGEALAETLSRRVVRRASPGLFPPEPALFCRSAAGGARAPAPQRHAGRHGRGRSRGTAAPAAGTRPDAATGRR